VGSRHDRKTMKLVFAASPLSACMQHQGLRAKIDCLGIGIRGLVSVS